MQKRALARARLSDDGDHLAGIDAKAQVAKERELAAGGFVGLLEVRDLDER